MQSPTPQRPVMDISTPRRPAPAVPMPPSVDSDDVMANAKPPASPAVTPASVEASTPSLPVREAPRQSDDATDLPEENASSNNVDAEIPTTDSQPVSVRQKPRDTAPIPVGAIVMTVLVMVILSAIAVMIYLKSQ